jgi:elongation factor Ts
MKKYLADICLLDQAYVMDDKKTVAAAIADAGKACGAQLSIKSYSYIKVGGEVS